MINEEVFGLDAKFDGHLAIGVKKSDGWRYTLVTH